MRYYKLSFLSTYIAFILLIITTNPNLQAQSAKKTLMIEDVELWRNHSVKLSDDGNWYTVLYSLIEKPEANNKKQKIDKAKTDSIDISTYGNKARTDVLYIYNSKTGLKYKIPGGSKPVFSSSSQWIAYTIKAEESEKKNKEKEKNIIELRNLESGITKQYKSNASFYFPKDKDLFITSDKKSLLIYDLEKQSEHYIGNIGEYQIDLNSYYIAYTISSEDKRGNGVYIYNPKNKTTRALFTGSCLYSNLGWSEDGNALAAIKYNMIDEEIDFENIRISLVKNLYDDISQSIEYSEIDLEEVAENMGIAVKSGQGSYPLVWSNDKERLFLKIKKYEDKPAKQKKEDLKVDDDATVNIWHWKDKKLLSQRMLEEKRNSNLTYDALFLLRSKVIVPLSSKEIQDLIKSKGTDNWAIGTDNRNYISDWDVRKNDLYRIDLTNGEKNLIFKEYPGSIQTAPDGENIILWLNEDYWSYNFEANSKFNLTSGLDVSFINDEDDHYGNKPNYGFVGWVKDRDAIIVNHKYDLWLLPLDTNTKAENLTVKFRKDDKIRYRLDDISFARETEIEERYIDLSSPIIISTFDTKTKYSGYYNFENHKFKKLIYGPNSFGSSRRMSGITRAKNSDIIVFKKGDYNNYPESYLSNIDFSKAKKITNTNPQQNKYKWGKRLLFDYTNDDGVELQGLLSIPDSYKKGQKLPMLVYSYEKMSQSMYQYPTPKIGGASTCEMMYVSDDYLYMQPDIHFNIGTPHSDMHECIDAAIAKVIELGYVDKERIGYEGFSYGGHCGMYISTQENRFAAIAAGAGVSNLIQGFNIDIVRDGSNEQDYYIMGQGRLGTDPTSNTEMFISESAVFNAAGMNTPLLLFHGTADEVVKWEHSFGLYSILRYLKKPVVFLSYQGEGHGLKKKANRLDIQIRLKEYFDHYLKGKEAGKWIEEEIPFEPKKEDITKEKEKEKENKQRPVPVWK